MPRKSHGFRYRQFALARLRAHTVCHRRSKAELSVRYTQFYWAAVGGDRSLPQFFVFVRTNVTRIELPLKSRVQRELPATGAAVV